MTVTKTETRSSVDLRYPSMYNVILHNDNTTPFEFVIGLLVDIFNRQLTEANDITVAVHEKGKGVAGTYNYEIAETKRQEAILISRAKGFQLKIDLEEL